jgi:ABC-type Fe3+ transport system substrate-binding protein
MVRRSIAGLLLSIGLLLARLSVAPAETMDELYEKAKLEKTLVVYTGGGPAAARAWATAFEKRFPGVTATAIGGFSNALEAEIDQQLDGGRVTTDFVHLQNIADFYRWDKRGALLHFKPDGFDQVYPWMKDADGAWVAVNAVPLLYGYTREKVQAQDVPKSALDFLRPEFRGKIVSVYPAADDATLYNFFLIVQKYGWDYMKRYMENRPYFIVGHRDVAARVRSGEDWVSLDISGGQGGNLQSVMSEKDKTPVFFVAGAILKDAPHPNAAKLFLTWALSRDEQERGPAGYSPRADVPPPPGMSPLTSDRFATGYRDFLGDGSRLPELRRRFESFTGPVVNKAMQ